MGARLVGASLAISALVLARRSGFIFDILSIFDIIYLTREPLVSAHLTAGKICTKKIAPYLTRTRALFFMLKNCYNKGYNSTKHDDKSKQVTVCNHKHQPPFA